MLYGGTITVLTTHTKAAPLETVFKLTHGIITRVLFYPRPGQKAMCHAKVLYWEHQIFPTDPEQDLHGDANPIIWDEWYELYKFPFEVTVVAWNDSTTYDHTFDIWFAVMPIESTVSYALSKALGAFIGMVQPKIIPVESD